MQNSQFILLVALTFAAGSPAFAQQAAERQSASSVQPADTQTTSGTVVTASRTSLLLRTEDGRHELFVFDDNASKPPSI
ncbi:MAG TPA: hypothetical protein VLA17_08030, partial [Candidatus Limnocylindria bacterium]|nr:hypothetical protein [Candidatus Limnocylindria bacterium]